VARRIKATEGKGMAGKGVFDVACKHAQTRLARLSQLEGLTLHKSLKISATLQKVCTKLSISAIGPRNYAYESVIFINWHTTKAGHADGMG